MLRTIKQPNMLPYSPLMEIYADSLHAAAKLEYPNLAENQAILQAEQDFYSYLYNDFFSSPEAACFLWELRQRPVAAVRIESYLDGRLLTGLETLPEMRNRGIGKELLTAVLHYAKQEGVMQVYSHVTKNNAASLAVHKACGFSIVSNYAVCLDGSTDGNMYTLCVMLQ